MKPAKLSAALAISLLALVTTTACGTQNAHTLTPSGASTSGASVNGTTGSNGSTGSNHLGAGSASTSTNVGAKGVDKKVTPKQQTQAQTTINSLENTVNQLH